MLKEFCGECCKIVEKSIAIYAKHVRKHFRIKVWKKDVLKCYDNEIFNKKKNNVIKEVLGYEIGLTCFERL